MRSYIYRLVGRFIGPFQGGAPSMANDNQRPDTFFVRLPEEPSNYAVSRLENMEFPDGHQVHALDRGVFERAIREAMKSVE